MNMVIDEFLKKKMWMLIDFLSQIWLLYRWMMKLWQNRDVNWLFKSNLIAVIVIDEYMQKSGCFKSIFMLCSVEFDSCVGDWWFYEKNRDNQCFIVLSYFLCYVIVELIVVYVMWCNCIDLCIILIMLGFWLVKWRVGWRRMREMKEVYGILWNLLRIGDVLTAIVWYCVYLFMFFC